MKSIIITSLCCLIGFTTPTFADRGWGRSGLVENVVEAVTDLLSDNSYRGASASNFAINTQSVSANVDIAAAGGRIRMGGQPATVNLDVTQTLTSSNINAGASSITQNARTSNTNVNSAVTNTLNNVTTADSNAVASLSAIALANSISATAIGAMNAGTINLTQALRAGEGISTYNPSAANVAINTAEISASVIVNAIDNIKINNTSISASAVGAMNTGNISVAPPAISNSNSNSRR